MQAEQKIDDTDLLKEPESFEYQGENNADGGQNSDSRAEEEQPFQRGVEAALGSPIWSAACKKN